MIDLKRLVQITLFLLALVSSALLGLGLESPRLIMIAFIGATIGFIVTDLLKLFRIDGVLANLASIVILFLAMSDFFAVDSTGKLVSVANLLVYLQTVLMFQEKTPRLNWQILVLSLLQVVVGTIFTLDLEAGLLFLVYFLVAGTAMVLQSVYTDNVEMEKRNRLAANRVARTEESSGPLLYFDPGASSQSSVVTMVRHLGTWLAMAVLFTAVMFYLVPRHAKPWYGPSNVEVTSTGISKSVDLDERGLITLSNQLIFRVKFTNVSTGKPLEVEGNQPYFRGLALSSLVIEDGKTNWVAPHDRVNKELYQPVTRFPLRGIPVYQKFTMEESIDPLLYGVWPFFRTVDTPEELTFCHEVSALARCQINDMIDMAPYKYQAGTLLRPDGQFCKAWPYVSNTRMYSTDPMSEDPLQHEWLTEMDPTRYPSIVGVSDELARENAAANGSRLDLMKRMEKFFLEAGRFKYTLDFREIVRNERLDPVEDFVRNHRSGHCELYASALTLMLRRQGIPARLVVGFYGVEENRLTGGYQVRGKNAHAWVEAYLRPADCPRDMFTSGEAGPGGAWMNLDATPFSSERGNSTMSENTMELARTVWDDYVLGMDAQENANDPTRTLSFFRFLQYFDFDRLDDGLKSTEALVRNRMVQFILVGAMALLMFVAWIWARLKQKNSNQPKKVGLIRRFVADAISLIAPGLAAWVMEGRTRHKPTAFYQRMTNLLLDVDLKRRPSQTHREFAQEVADHFQSHPESNMIQSTVREITELFNEVRFGRIELDPELNAQIEMSLDELKVGLKTPTATFESPDVQPA